MTKIAPKSLRSCLFTLLVFGPVTSACTPEAGTARLDGVVKDFATGEPLAGATVQVAGSVDAKDMTVSDSSGHFTLDRVPERCSIDLNAPGHAFLRRSLRLAAGEQRDIDFFLVLPGSTLPDSSILFIRGGNVWRTDPAGLNPVDLTADLEGTQDSPTWNGDRSQFAFINRIPGRTKIFARHPDGSPARFIMDVPDSASQLRWCQDSRQMIFTCASYTSTRGQTTEIRWFDAFSGTQRDLVAGAEERDPAWSPDGQTIAWARRFPSRTSEIWLSSSSGGAQRPLITGFNALEPAFSPDGKRMAFASNREGSWNLFEAAVESPHPRRITQVPSGGWARRPQYSPLGDEILYETNVHQGSVESGGDLCALNLRTLQSHEVLDDAHQANW